MGWVEFAGVGAGWKGAGVVKVGVVRGGATLLSSVAALALQQCVLILILLFGQILDQIVGHVFDQDFLPGCGGQNIQFDSTTGTEQ